MAEKTDFSQVDAARANECVAFAKEAIARKNHTFAHDVLQTYDRSDPAQWQNEYGSRLDYGDRMREKERAQLRVQVETELRVQVETELRAQIEKELRERITADGGAQTARAGRYGEATAMQPSAAQVQKWCTQAKVAFDDGRYVEAFAAFEKAAEYGDATAQNWLGYCYYHGKGAAKDYAAAFKWFTAAAKQGNANAQDWLGHCYEYGHGVPKDKAAAVRWYRAAAQAGILHAKDGLARLSYKG